MKHITKPRIIGKLAHPIDSPFKIERKNVVTARAKEIIPLKSKACLLLGIHLAEAWSWCPSP
jgi:hypothetical protein